MDENKVREIIQKHAEGQFPRTCPCCGVAFNSLAEYYESTTRLGDPISYDAEIDDWEPEKPVGTVFFVNCKCGNTLSISSKGVNHSTLRRMMQWFRLETERRGVDMSELLGNIRSEIRRSVLSESTDD